MRLTALLLLTPAVAGAAALETMRMAAERDFLRASDVTVESLIELPAPPEIQPPLKPVPVPFDAMRSGREVVRVNLEQQLDRNLHLMNRQFGARAWDVGSVGDLASKNYFFTFTSGADVKIAPVGDVNRLRGKGIDVRVDAATVYNFRLQATLPIRSSRLIMTPINGTQGPSHNMKIGEVLDAVKAKSVVFKADRVEYWLQYGRDVQADGSAFKDTRSFLFIHEAGLNSKAWPLAESSLPVGQATEVDLDGTTLVLIRTAAGELIVASR